MPCDQSGRVRKYCRPAHLANRHEGMRGNPSEPSMGPSVVPSHKIPCVCVVFRFLLSICSPSSRTQNVLQENTDHMSRPENQGEYVCHAEIYFMYCVCILVLKIASLRGVSGYLASARRSAVSPARNPIRPMDKKSPIRATKVYSCANILGVRYQIPNSRDLFHCFFCPREAEGRK